MCTAFSGLEPLARYGDDDDTNDYFPLLLILFFIRSACWTKKKRLVAADSASVRATSSLFNKSLNYDTEGVRLALYS